MKLSRLSLVIAVLLPSFFPGVGQAATEKYRVLWNDSPDSRATVGWCYGEGDEEATVHYGTEDFGDDWEKYPLSQGVDRKTEQKELRSAFARLSDLEADTNYYFVIRDEDGSSPRFWFRTAPDGPAEFTFVAGGDSRNHRDARLNANRAVAKLRPLFVCFGGDMTNRATPEEWAAWFDDWEETFGEDGRIFPLIAARGNHEHKDDVHKLFDTPIPDDYYALSVGGDYLRVYTMNSNIVRAGEQGAWLKADLEAHKGAHWKMAHYHHPFRPHQSKKAEQYAQYNAWAKLFYDYGLNFVVECDSHVVKRTWPVRPSNEPGSDEGFIRDDENGTVFVGEGCWGAPLRPADDLKNWTRDSGSFNQVNWVMVTPQELRVRSVLVDEVDSFATVDDTTPLQEPKGLKLWQAENGALVTVPHRGGGVVPELDPATLTRVEVIFGEEKFSEQTEVRLEVSDESFLQGEWEIRYTTDGSAPAAGSDVYKKPFEISATTTVRAAVFVGGKALTADSGGKAVRKSVQE